MSRTHKDKPSKLLWGDYMADYIYVEPFFHIWRKTTKPKVRRTKDTEWEWYKGTPSWWNHLFHTKPRRQQSRGWATNVVKSPLDEHTLDELDTPNYSNRPHKYYW